VSIQHSHGLNNTLTAVRKYLGIPYYKPIEAVRVSVEAVRLLIEALRCFRGRESVSRGREIVDRGLEMF
jgi:hypothetical protein